MILELSEEQKLFQQSLRRFISNEAPLSGIRQLEQQQQEFDRSIYQRMDELGLLELGLPVEYGENGTFLDAALWFEIMGENLLVTPQLYSIIAINLLYHSEKGPANWKSSIDALIQGEKFVSLAFYECYHGDWSDNVQTTVSVVGNEVILQGKKNFVCFLEQSKELLVTATGEAGLVLLWVPLATPGISTVAYHVQGGRKVSEAIFDQVRLDASAIILRGRSTGEIISAQLDRARILHAAWGAGAAKGSLDKVSAYVKQREQFGRPIGSFQAIQHKLADVLLLIEEARWLTYYAAWCVDKKLNIQQPAASSLLRSSEAFETASAKGSLLHGGYGFMEEYDIQLFFRRTKFFQQEFGGRAELRKRIGLGKFREVESFRSLS